MHTLTTLLLKIPRGLEVTPEAAQTFLAALTQINSVSGFEKFRGGRSQALSLEIVLARHQIMFLVTCDTDLVPFVEAQIQSNYPLVIMERILDPIANVPLEVKELSLRKGNFYPIATYPAFQEIDPLSSILTVLSKQQANHTIIVQLSLEAIGGSWQSSGQSFADKGGGVTEDGKAIPHPDATIIKEKISYPGFAVSFRVAADTKQALAELASAYGVFAKADGNAFGGKKRGLLSRVRPLKELRSRKVTDNQVLNIVEIATLWHLPGEKIKTSSIIWGQAVLSESPEKLPTVQSKSEDDRMSANFFAHTLHNNRDAVFGINDRDRSRHMWVVGKSGTGKSTMIANMVIDDIRKGKGVAIIDPHGDLCETVLDYIPSNRINQVIYFNPSDREKQIVINPLEVGEGDDAELVVSGLMSVFTKIWENVWSARMEYILRNTLLTLAQVPNATFSDVLQMLSNDVYRDYIISKINDHSLKVFWVDEYNKMPERLQKEAISPIQNKVGQFVTSPLIRTIIGSPKSTIRLDNIMDDGMILLANLSQGKMGEDNSALLGATLITKLQQAAMKRVYIDEDKRRDFYLFVDEFQNFATSSFIKILSEARKYRLNLMLANQYMAQIPEEVSKAILGNVGTLISFGVGAEDAEIIHKEFSEVFSQNDLVNLSNHQIAIKLLIDGHANRPFLAHTLPLPASTNNNKALVIAQSKERYGADPIDPKPIEVPQAFIEKKKQEHRDRSAAGQRPGQGGGGQHGGGQRRQWQPRPNQGGGGQQHGGQQRSYPPRPHQARKAN